MDRKKHLQLTLRQRKRYGASSGNGQFGLGSVTLSYSGGQEPVTMLTGITPKTSSSALLDLRHGAFNFTNFNQPAPTVSALLKNADKINSNNWEVYCWRVPHPKQTYGSLTFGAA